MVIRECSGHCGDSMAGQGLALPNADMGDCVATLWVLAPADRQETLPTPQPLTPVGCGPRRARAAAAKASAPLPPGSFPTERVPPMEKSVVGLGLRAAPCEPCFGLAACFNGLSTPMQPALETPSCRSFWGSRPALCGVPPPCNSKALCTISAMFMRSICSASMRPGSKRDARLSILSHTTSLSSRRARSTSSCCSMASVCAFT
mmetsp:Transcript_118361/g.334474  ORF Transcript_118361/g.334474 Transcript_118361/m.334474 type:complete len:204 (+) Transcript_118361:1039-1650(+)